MTFSELVTAVANRLNITAPASQVRIGQTLNDRYRRVMSAVGLNTTRRSTINAAIGLGASTITFTNCEKIVNVVDRSTTPYRVLKEITIEELRRIQPYVNSFPSQYAIVAYGANSVTIEVDTIAQSTFTLYADVESTVSTLSGTDTPNFPEDFHDVLMHGALADEYRKMEKLNLAQDSETLYERRLSDLRMWIAKSSYLDIYQGKTRGRVLAGPSVSGSGGGSSGVNGAASYTQTGLITFDRSGSGAGWVPFAVASGAAKVSNLDADLLDGKDWNTAGALPDAGLGLTDVTTNDVTSTKHGFAPKSPGNASTFLNGAATPAYAQVTGSDLSLSDVTTNNVTSTKHGFAPKSPADATTFLNGAATPAYAQVKDSDLSTSDILTNNVSTTKHGFTPKAPNDTAQVLLGDATWGIGFGLITQGRLTFTSGTPVTQADVTGASTTTLYFTPFQGNRIALYNGSIWKLYSFTERSIALPATTNTVYDVFIFDNSGTLTLELLAWTNDTTRATALTTQDGVLVKSGATTRKYLGSVRTGGISGQSSDSAQVRYLWNYYNRFRRPLRLTESTTSWTYGTASFRQVNANTNNTVFVLAGIADTTVNLSAFHLAANSVVGSANSTFALTGIGYDSTTVPVNATGTPHYPYVANVPVPMTAHLVHMPDVGKHQYNWLEYSLVNNGGTVTFYRFEPFTGGMSTGLVGWIEG